MTTPTILNSIIDHDQAGRVFYNDKKNELSRTGYGIWGSLYRKIRWLTHKKTVRIENRNTFDLVFFHVEKRFGEYTVQQLKSDPVIFQKYKSGDSITKKVSGRIREILREGRQTQAAYLQQAYLPGGEWYREISDALMAQNRLQLEEVEVDGDKVDFFDPIPLTPEMKVALETELSQVLEQYCTGLISFQDAVSGCDSVARRISSGQMKQYMEFFEQKNIQDNRVKAAILASLGPGIALVDTIGAPARGTDLPKRISKANAALQNCICVMSDIQKHLGIERQDYLSPLFDLIEQLTPNPSSRFEQNWNHSIGCEYLRIWEQYQKNLSVIPGNWANDFSLINYWLGLLQHRFSQAMIVSDPIDTDFRLLEDGFQKIFEFPEPKPENPVNGKIREETQLCRLMDYFFETDEKGISRFRVMVSDFSRDMLFLQENFFLKREMAGIEDRVRKEIWTRRGEILSLDKEEQVQLLRTITQNCVAIHVRESLGLSSEQLFSQKNIILDCYKQSAANQKIRLPTYVDTHYLVGQIQNSLKLYEGYVPPLSIPDAREIVVSTVSNFLRQKTHIDEVIDQAKGFTESGKVLLKRLNWLNGDIGKIGELVKRYGDRSFNIREKLIQRLNETNGISAMLSFFHEYPEPFAEMKENDFRDLCQFSWEIMEMKEKKSKLKAKTHRRPVIQPEKQAKRSELPSVQFLFSDPFREFVFFLARSANSGGAQERKKAIELWRIARGMVNAASRRMDETLLEETGLSHIQEILVNWKSEIPENQPVFTRRIEESMKPFSIPVRMQILDAGLVKYDTVRSYGTAEGIGFRRVWDHLKNEWNKAVFQGGPQSEELFKNALLFHLQSRLASQENISAEEAENMVKEVAGELIHTADRLYNAVKKYQVSELDVRLPTLLGKYNAQELDWILSGIPYALAPLSELFQTKGRVGEKFGDTLIESLYQIRQFSGITGFDSMQMIFEGISYLLDLSPYDTAPKQISVNEQAVSPKSMTAFIRNSSETTLPALKGEIRIRLTEKEKASEELRMVQAYLQTMIPEDDTTAGFVDVMGVPKEIIATIDHLTSTFFM